MVSILVIIVSIFVLLHVFGVSLQTWHIAVGTWEPAIDWSVAAWLKVAIVALRAMMTILLFVLFVIFVANILRSPSALFVRANVRLLFWGIAPMFLYSLCDCNMQIINGMRYFQISTEALIAPMVLLVVALIYRRGVLLAEENDLTI